MHPRPPPTTDPYSHRTFTGTAGKEALVLDSRDNGRTITALRCDGGSTCLRLFECGGITLVDPVLRGPLGPPDPDGQACQIIRPTGPIRLIRPRFIGSPWSEDLLSIFADQPCNGSVLVEDGEWWGKGTSLSGTSACLDGPFCPPVTLQGGTIDGARCAVTVAGGTDHGIDGVGMTNCGVKIYIYKGYDPGVAPSVTLHGYTPADVLVGLGAGAVVYR